MMENIELPLFKFKRDSYMRSRGAPAMLMISCSACNTFLMCYQKDGPGLLKRCYLDRIHYPSELEILQKTCFSKNQCPELSCKKCNVHIATPIVYEKENRLAYHLRIGSVSLKKIPARKRLHALQT
jgi:hypothetical protein